MKIDHITLSVTDPQRSAEWYELVLGEATRGSEEGPGWRRTALGWPDGMGLVLICHDETPSAEAFSHLRVGLDHLSFACSDEAEVRAWVERLDALGIDHGPLEEPDYGWVVTARDPDGIAVEFYASKE